MDSLEEAQRLMELVQRRVNGQEVISGEAAIQLLTLRTALAQAEQLERIANALESANRMKGNSTL